MMQKDYIIFQPIISLLGNLGNPTMQMELETVCTITAEAGCVQNIVLIRWAKDMAGKKRNRIWKTGLGQKSISIQIGLTAKNLFLPNGLQPIPGGRQQGAYVGMFSSLWPTRSQD